MRMSRTVVAMTGYASPLLAAIITLVATTSTLGQVVLSPLDRGWYNEFGFHDPANPNFFVGDGRGPLGGVPVPYQDVRNFFVFDLTEATEPVATATLSLTIFETLGFSNGFISNSKVPVETYQLAEVTSDPFDVVSGCVGDPDYLHLPDLSCRALGESIHADLGDGELYGVVDISVSDLGTKLNVPLNGSAVAELDAARTSTLIFSLGGSLTTLDEFANDEFAFAGTAEPSAVAVLILGSTVDADINDDAKFDCRDVDVLVQGIAAGNHDATLDLTGDGLVDAADLDQWLSIAGEQSHADGAAYQMGDANLDGIVDVSDFNILNTNRGRSLAGWCGGDIDANGEVGDGDFAVWNANKFGASVQSRNVTIPEPGQLPWSLVLVFFAAWSANRRKTGLL